VVQQRTTSATSRTNAHMLVQQILFRRYWINYTGAVSWWRLVPRVGPQPGMPPRICSVGAPVAATGGPRSNCQPGWSSVA